MATIGLENLSNSEFVGGFALRHALTAPMLSLLKTDVQAWNKFKSEWDDLKIYDAETEFSYSNLEGINIAEANLSGANFRKSNLTGANLSGANLEYTDLDEANLSGANLTGANLSRSWLGSVNLTGANLSKATLNNVALDHVNFTGANLEEASITNVFFCRVKLAGAKLKGALIGDVLINDQEDFDALSTADLAGLRVVNDIFITSKYYYQHMEELARLADVREEAKRLQIPISALATDYYYHLKELVRVADVREEAKRLQLTLL